MGSKQVMTPDHPLWPMFLSRLSRVPICGRTTENAQAVMAYMPDIDVKASLAALAELGGRCDCEIEFDVDRQKRLGNRRPERTVFQRTASR